MAKLLRQMSPSIVKIGSGEQIKGKPSLLLSLLSQEGVSRFRAMGYTLLFHEQNTPSLFNNWVAGYCVEKPL
jgi:hypothetical protein